jgi:hypothetical protein
MGMSAKAGQLQCTTLVCEKLDSVTAQVMVVAGVWRHGYNAVAADAAHQLISCRAAPCTQSACTEATALPDCWCFQALNGLMYCMILGEPVQFK